MKRWLLIMPLVLVVHLADAQRLYKIYADAEETFYDERFGDALVIYQQIYEIDSIYEDIQYKIEICKLLSQRQYTDMAKFNAYEEIMARRDKFYYYWRGRILLEQYQFEDAIESLRRFIRTPASKSDIIIEEARRWIKWCESAKKYLDNPTSYEIKLLGDQINTVNAELSPVYFSDNDEMLFLSNRDAENPDQFIVYHSKLISERSWKSPEPISGLGIFTRESANIEVVAEDGRLFQFKNTRGGDLYFSESNGTKMGWTEPEKFDSKISSTDMESHFFINEHEDRIIFAKDVGSKKEPNLDLFQSYRDPKSGNWSKPALFSTTINSEYNEDSPYLSPDEKTLYFASDGHDTMGGYDIFRSTFDPESATWSEPENLGFPVNSPDDEMYFKLNPDQESGYFSSNRLNTFGDYDIFFFWEITKMPIRGRVLDGTTGEPVTDARIFFRPKGYSDMYFYSPLDANGQYQTEINSDDEYFIELKYDDKTSVALEDYETFGVDVSQPLVKDFYVGGKSDGLAEKLNASGGATASVPEQTSRPTQEEETQAINNIYVRNDRAVVRNIYFDFDQTHVTDESLPTLNALLSKMKSSPNMRIEIAGHTDNIGSNAINMKVSQRRADAVKNWLVENNIAADRIVTRGYGESRPMASNDDEINGRELNRRIEITVQ